MQQICTLLILSDIEGPDAINKHYTLLTAVMRVLCASVLSRGPQNQQTLEQGRRFLGENRLSILAVLKKSAGLGRVVATQEQSLDELADSFMLLISVSGFLEVSYVLFSNNYILISFSLKIKHYRQNKQRKHLRRLHDGFELGAHIML
jgi:hypothetical protein